MGRGLCQTIAESVATKLSKCDYDGNWLISVQIGCVSDCLWLVSAAQRGVKWHCYHVVNTLLDCWFQPPAVAMIHQHSDNMMSDLVVITRNASKFQMANVVWKNSKIANKVADIA